jgi:hypothetical protein
MYKEIKQTEELILMGGKFYTVGDESFCDTALATWKLIKDVGYVLLNEETGEPQ